ncbi:hypothetical protein C1645_825926 [Glomus cerebriforme]|uniref:Uncharacterized protein n=1 Tax=Glomus cerebriforme TaxID=658196 RepID=A0A397SRD8_9GLOM|nr:hypothetical protein C1645_825926 [Glomus cerebriforme]
MKIISFSNGDEIEEIDKEEFEKNLINKDSEAVEQDKQLITEPEQDEASDINNKEYSEIKESENKNKEISFKLVIRRDKYQRLNSNEKKMIIFADLKHKKVSSNKVSKRKNLVETSIQETNRKKEKSSANTVPKESNITENRVNVATNEHGLVTINEPLAFLMFASKIMKINKTSIQATLVAPSTSMPQFAFYPYSFLFYNYNASPKFPSPSNYNNS